ncbi:MAG TPA: response regulator [Pyrinomonadaceae bacterium]|nr:response regulator [Pyrinomonadaceae bacterium]
MRLEFEPNVATLPLVDNQAFDEVSVAPDPQVFLKRGIAAAQSGDRDRARIDLTRASALDPQCEDAWMWLASISEYPEELLAFLNNVLNINPENKRAVEWRIATLGVLAKTFVQRAVAAHNAGSDDLAAQCLEQAIEHDANCDAAWLWKAKLAETDDQQVELLNRVLAINPDNEDAKDALAAIDRMRASAVIADARSLMESGETEDAAEILNRVLDMHPDNAEAKDVLDQIAASKLKSAVSEAKAAAAAGKTGEAVEILNAALDKDPSNADAWMLLSHLSPNMTAKMNCLEKALELDPANAAARANLDFLSLTIVPGSMPVAEVEVSAMEEEIAVEAAADPVTEEFHQEEVAFESADEPGAMLEEELPAMEPEVATEVEVAAPDFEAEPEVAFEQVEEPAAFEEPVAEFETPETPAELAVDIAAPQAEMAATEEFSDEVVEEPVSSVEDIFAAANAKIDADTDTLESLPPIDEIFEQANVAIDQEFDATPASPFSAPAMEAVPDAVTETTPPPAVAPIVNGVECPFCWSPNEAQAFECISCHSTLSLSDLESLLSNDRVERESVQQAVTQMEAEWNLREFDEKELTNLGIGHFNLRNYGPGIRYLQEASRLNPNNVILSGQINTLVIRLDEMRRQDEARGPMTQGKTILVVDDSATVRKLISGKLEKSGHTVICAEDGVEGMTKIEESLPDLVLLDITMPRMDGYEVCKQIRANPASRNVPVVMISGKDGFFDKVRGRMAGTTGYITKPFGPETLMKALETYLEHDSVPVE